ncbi:hypothetical protein MSAN_02311700 [Mycena sanguinolenta]|uniref:Uncharacterized protein n=1 Tax=Mycena sanguinolenta TaxID=230812 RepID=A0A8H7CG06_9AGAR|nr:hypothetical protein MSAN_02311700 [Mycena sanguinolenta]
MTTSVRSSSARSSMSISTPNSSINAVKKPTPATQSSTSVSRSRTTRATGDAAKIFLDMTREEMLDASASGDNWGLYTATDVLASLYAKGYVSQEENESGKEGHKVSVNISLLAMAVLRVAMSLPTGTAVAADALRAIAVALRQRENDAILDEILQRVGVIHQHTEELVERRPGNEAEEGEMAASVRDAAVVLTRTVADIAETATRLEREMSDVAERVCEQVVERVGAAVHRTVTTQCADPPVLPGPSAGTSRSYAAAVAQALPPASRAALANAAARPRQIWIAHAEGNGSALKNLTEREIVEKARMALELMSRDENAPSAPAGTKFVGATKQRSGAAVLHMNSDAAAHWLKANMPAFLARMGGYDRV